RPCPLRDRRCGRDRPGLSRRRAPHHRLEGEHVVTLSTAIWSVFYWLTSKMGAAAVAVVGVVTFVWFAGPEIPWGSTYPLTSSSLRLVIILVVIVIAFIASLFLRRKRAKEDEALLAALRRQQDEELLAAKDDAARQK